MEEKNNKNYTLSIIVDGIKIVLLKDSLEKIDEFTTWFRHSAALIEQLDNRVDKYLSNARIIIENNRKHKIDFIGASFKNVINHYGDIKFVNTVCDIDFVTLEKMLDDLLTQKIVNATSSVEEYNKKYSEYMSKPEIPIVSALNNLKKINEGKEDEENIRNAKRDIRILISNYSSYRLMYCEVVSNGFFEQGKMIFDKEKKNMIVEKLDEMAKIIKTEMTKEKDKSRQMTFQVDEKNNLSVSDNFTKRREDDFPLEYIEYEDKDEDKEETYADKVINNQHLTTEQKISEIEKHVEDAEEFQKYMNIVINGRKRK